MMYKIVSAILSVSFLGLGVLLVVEKCNHAEAKEKYNNATAKLEGIKKETETGNSIRALIEEDLKAQADALQEIINDRDERILMQTKVNFRLEEMLLKAENAKESVVNKEGRLVLVTEENKCDDTLRYRVDFEIIEEPLRVAGFTLTNPAYAEIKLEWIDDFQLEMNLTKDDDGNFRVYTDSPNLEVKDLTLKVDSKVLEAKWYERISFGTDLALGEDGLQFDFRPGYDIFNNLNVSLLFVVLFDGAKAQTFYGAGVTWWPWK